ncbi:FadR/GntR family transcriptional regulator [Sporosarcina limicola]|uniref:DNA-binding FadR family transcriptional regulator n=1 Tax=Sporosarcina limicola TaxID=34101 RepID=A0A927MRY1_9BACL|nr:FadR/GntR family transcriptional regulator [Sporosarcina limicola]MBE1556256.1 DNA-binding FadR family transcriptional regulator [Sporosarcina limicola]
MIPQKKRMYEVIVSKIEDFLLDEGMEAGDRLPSERELAIMFTVSRTSVREALRALELSGAIEIRQRGGSFLKTPKIGRVHEEISAAIIEKEKHLVYEMLELRRALEVESVSLAAQRAKTADLEKIRQALENMAISATDIEAGVQADLQFHMSIVEATHNTIFIQLTQTLAEHMEDTIRVTRKYRFLDMNRYEETFEEHKAIYLAIASGDQEKAKRLMEDHILGIRRELSESFLSGSIGE